MRTAQFDRKTKETNIHLKINLDGTGEHQVATGIGFLDHMLAQLALHGLIDIVLQVSGDLHVDFHHTVEDVALSLGTAVSRALEDRKGIVRMAHALVPMDEALCQVVLDVSGRPYCVFKGQWTGNTVGSISVTLIEHFLQSFSTTLGATLHAQILYGRDDHHKAEALFKALARSLSAATRFDPRREEAIPSTKGVI